MNLRDFLSLDLDPQISAGNHHPVSVIQNLVNIIHTLLILDLGYDLNLTSPGIQNSLYRHNILLIAHEGVSNKIQIIIYCKINKRPVLITQRFQFQGSSRYIYTLTILNDSLISHHHFQIMIFFLDNNQLHIPVVHQHLVSHFYIFSKIRIGHVNQFPIHLQLWISCQINRFSPIYIHRFIHKHRSHFRSLRVDQDGYIIRNFPNILHYLQRLLHILMSSI